MSNWANKGKEALKSVDVGPKLERVGGLESAIAYYSAKEANPEFPKQRQLKENDYVQGLYEGSYVQTFTKKKGGTFTSTNHRIRTDEGLVIVAHNGKFNEAMTSAIEGKLVRVTNVGQYTIQNGPYKGTVGTSFAVDVDRS